MVALRKIRTLAMLAVIAHPLAEDLAFQTVHQATPEIVATMTEKDAAKARFLRNENV